MSRKISAKKTGGRKTAAKTSIASKKSKVKRFDVSLVILIGMLTFSSMLFLVSLNRTLGSGKGMPQANYYPIELNKQQAMAFQNDVLDDENLGFTLAVPAQMGKWLYKTGHVQSLTDESLSDQYLKIYIPFPGKNYNDMDKQYKEILTIRKMTAEEWADIQKDCEKEGQKVCDLAGKKIDLQADGAKVDEDYVYAYTMADDCPGNIVARCNLANEIVKSFTLK
ncbi:MAG: hypothetical protein PHF35_01215 [Candidatus Moranbacteria bacterium]|nr:hypothetical protein [Candidatus Moranbacteria bacterium]